MAVYGAFAYATETYGDSSVSNTLFQSTMEAYSGTVRGGASADQHGRVTVTWVRPGGDWDRMRVVRSAAGFPTHAADGKVLLDKITANFTDSLTDLVTGPRNYYYTLFVRATDNSGRKLWVESANTIGLAVADLDYGRTLLNRVPKFFSTGSGALGEASTDSPLGRFCALLGFKVEEYISVLQLLSFVNDPDLVPGTLLPTLGQQVGVVYDAEIGMHRNRVLIRNAVRLSKVKTTERGLVGLASSVTGYGATLVPFRNVLSNSNESSAVRTTAGWTVSTGATLTRSSEAPGNTDAYQFKITNNATAKNIEFFGPRLIALTPGTVSVSLLGRSAAAGVTGQTSVLFYDQRQNFISESTPLPNAINNSTTWQRFLSSFQAPAGTMYGQVRYRLNSVPANAVHYLDDIQVEQGQPTAYQTPRILELLLKAERVNEIRNAGFDSSVANWTSTGTLTYDPAVFADSPGGSAKLVRSGGAATLSQTVPVDPNQPLAMAGQVRSTGAGTAALAVVLRDSANNVINTITGPVQATNSTFARLLLQTQTSADTASITYQITLAGPATEFWIDDCLAEHSNGIGDYISPQTHPGDALYDGPFDAGRVHYYPVYVARRKRLLDLLDEQTPVGSAVSLVVAQPRSGTPVSSSSPTNFTDEFVYEDFE